MSSTDWRRDLIRRSAGIASTALRYRWFIVASVLVAGAFAAYRQRQMGVTYTTSAKFLTQSQRGAAAANGLAAQFGISLGTTGADPTQSPEFYTELLVSRPVLERTARASYVLSNDTSQKTTLSQHYGSDDAAIARVRGGIASNVSAKTGIVSFTVRAESPMLAQQIAQELLRQVDYFNRERRRTRSAAERTFVGQRLTVADSELRASEDQLEAFYTRNRGFERSPDLKFQEERLTREVTRRQQVSAALSQAFEQAKIDEVRDVPVITVFEEPQLPKGKDRRNSLSRIALTMLMAALGAFFVGLLVDLFRGVKVGSVDEFVELRTLGAEFLGELRNPSRVFARKRSAVSDN